MVDGIVLVSRFNSDGLYADRAVVYTEDDAEMVLQQYHYHFWSESPQTLLQAELVEWLRAANLSQWVVSRREARPSSI